MKKLAVLLSLCVVFVVGCMGAEDQEYADVSIRKDTAGATLSSPDMSDGSMSLSLDALEIDGDKNASGVSDDPADLICRFCTTCICDEAHIHCVCFGCGPWFPCAYTQEN